MGEHPTPDELQKLFEGRLPSGQCPEVVAHLLEGCGSCDEVLKQLAHARTDRASKPCSRDFFQEIVEAREVSALLAQGGGVQTLVDYGDIPLQGYGRYLAIRQRSWDVRHHSPREMVELARAALQVIERLNPRDLEPRQLADLQARAWGELANAYRTQDQMDDAERAFGRAFELLLQGTGSLSLKAEIHCLYASFLGAYRRFELAFAALDIAYLTYLELGNRHSAGRALIIKGIYTLYKGHPEDALVINEAGRQMIDQEQDPPLLPLAIQNRLAALVACGRFREAKKEFFKLRGTLNRLEGRVNTLKVRWLWAQINAGLDQWNTAETELFEVRAGFEGEGMRFHAALAALEIALLWLRQARTSETKELVLETVDVFIALRIPREALGAVVVLQDAARKDIMTVNLLASVVEHLWRSQMDPDAPFTPRW